MEQQLKQYDEISNEEKASIVRMFCAYCRRTLANAKTDAMREKARRAKKERLFSDMLESELNRLVAPESVPAPEALFSVEGELIGVSDPDLAAALWELPMAERAIILLHYFAGWPDGRVGEKVGLPRSTVQWKRVNALNTLRESLRARGVDHDLL